MPEIVEEPVPLPPPIPRPAAPDPLSAHETWSAVRRPDRLLNLVLGERSRVIATVADGRGIWPLIFALLVASVLVSLPYGAVLEPDELGNIALLLLGSMLVCFPSLQVFSNFVGLKVDVAQHLALALLITAVASCFTFGFFPILWFLQNTMGAGEAIDSHDLHVTFLTFSVLAGLCQLMACFALGRKFGFFGESYGVLILIWQTLFLFITYRMALFLELT